MEDRAPYLTFASAADAESVAERLKAASIEVEIVKKLARLDEAIIGTDYSDRYEVYIPAADYTKANGIVYDKHGVSPESIDTSHPLLKMSNAELIEIVKNPDEWGPDNYGIALGVLKTRGVVLSDEELEAMEKEKISSLLQKKSVDIWLILLGYLSAVAPLLQYLVSTANQRAALAWYISPVFGIVLCVAIIKSKTTLPDGRRVAMYDARANMHAKIIVVLSLVFWAINTLLHFSGKV